MNNRPFRRVGFFGLLLIPFAIVLIAIGPPKDKAPKGYSSVIVAFEFASDENEVQSLLGNLGGHNVKKLDLVNYIDFPFMVIYGIFLFLFLSKLEEISGDSLLKFLKWMIPIIVLCDLCENLQLLRLTKQYSLAMTYANDTIHLLEWFTWSKWLLLGLAFAIISIGVIRIKPKYKIVSVICLIPIFVGTVAFSTHRPAIEDAFALSISIGFSVLLLYCFIYQPRQIITE